jgi:hypothetical protein
VLPLIVLVAVVVISETLFAAVDLLATRRRAA